MVKMFQQINGRISIAVKVIPKASRTEIVGWENGELKIRLAAVPDKGEANQELIRYLAHFFNIGKSHVHLLRGATSRHKLIAFSTLTEEIIRSKLNLEGL